MQPGNILTKGESETGAAGSPGSGRVGFPEGLCAMADLLGRHAAAFIRYRESPWMECDAYGSQGAAFSGGLTYVTFMPRCYKLRNTLRKYRLCDPDFYAKEGSAQPRESKPF